MDHHYNTDTIASAVSRLMKSSVQRQASSTPISKARKKSRLDNLIGNHLEVLFEDDNPTGKLYENEEKKVNPGISQYDPSVGVEFPRDFWRNAALDKEKSDYLEKLTRNQAYLYTIPDKDNGHIVMVQRIGKDGVPYRTPFYSKAGKQMLRFPVEIAPILLDHTNTLMSKILEEYEIGDDIAAARKIYGPTSAWLGSDIFDADKGLDMGRLQRLDWSQDSQRPLKEVINPPDSKYKITAEMKDSGYKDAGIIQKFPDLGDGSKDLFEDMKNLIVQKNE